MSLLTSFYNHSFEKLRSIKIRFSVHSLMRWRLTFSAFFPKPQRFKQWNMLRSQEMLRRSLCIFLCFPGRAFTASQFMTGQSEGGWEDSQPIRGEEADDTAISDIMTTVNIGHLPVMEPGSCILRKKIATSVYILFSLLSRSICFYFLVDRK